MAGLFVSGKGGSDHRGAGVPPSRRGSAEMLSSIDVPGTWEAAFSLSPRVGQAAGAGQPTAMDTCDWRWMSQSGAALQVRSSPRVLITVSRSLLWD